MLEHDAALALIKLAQQGDNDAKEKLIEENIPLIKSIVKRYKGRLEYDDLMQLGAMGFIKAIQNFDETFGVRFSTYAVPMISGEIKRYLRDDGSIKVSRWTKTLAQKISVYVDTQLKNGEKEPTIDDIAKEFDIEPQEVVFAMDTTQYVLSLSASIGDDDGATIADRIVGDLSPDESLDKLMLVDSIKKLPPREKSIIVLRYFRDKTQSEIAKELGVSQVQVSRIEGRILKKIKDELDDEDL